MDSVIISITGSQQPQKWDEHSALLVVDPQNDFMPGGALPIPDGDTIVPIVNQYIRGFLSTNRPVFVSRDWHPTETVHFSQWPPHCIKNTWGAEFHKGIDVTKLNVITKGRFGWDVWKRKYVRDPYTMGKDMVNGKETDRLREVLDGDLALISWEHYPQAKNYQNHCIFDFVFGEDY